MKSKIKINNIFRNNSISNEIILVCTVIIGEINIGDKIKIDKNLYLLILNIEKNNFYNEINLYIDNYEVDNFNFFELIGNNFDIYPAVRSV